MISSSDPSQPSDLYERRSTRFAFGLLAYFILTVILFYLVWRYIPRIADRIGGIENGWLQFGIYFIIYIAMIRGATMLGRRTFQTLRRETLLRLCFAVGATLSFVVAVYQARFGTGLSATYFAVGVLGTFGGALLATQRYFGLIEVNSPPSVEATREVEAAHAGVAIANDTWDHVKRAVELVLSLALIMLSLPISVLLAMVIWLQDPGPLLFAKIVVTRGGKSFRQFKLRSMVKDAEQATGAIPAALDDQRVTMFGQMLRRTHIDELPQMINIALGDMSLVGPRPERTIFVRRHLQSLPRYALRHAVRPGLAGMAQIYGDYYSTPREKLRYDLLYIRRRSFSLDIRLFVSATLVGLVGKWPGMNRGRRHFTARRQQQRWRDAYEALHGGPAPELAQMEQSRAPQTQHRAGYERVSTLQDEAGSPIPKQP
jgi:lipopolysaccharide/colanic/teichoic acid biosynthesis glycosyltransferase